jgi:chromatin remodeling complex protein RSC6
MPVTKKTTIKRKTVTKKTTDTKPVEAPVVAESTPVVENTVENTVDSTSNESKGDTEPSLNESFDLIISQLDSLLNTTKGLKGECKRLQKRSKKELADAQKRSRGKRSKQVGGEDKPKRAPSGFAKPSEISKTLCDFLGKPIGTEMARTEVTKYITQYIKAHNLQNPENKRHIIPDAKLGDLLNVTNNEVVTYFNLQKYMKHHFPKSAAALAAEAAALTKETTSA